MLLGDNDGVVKSDGRGRPSIVDHEAIEIYLGRYTGLMLYLKEMDEGLYAKLCAVSGVDTLCCCHLNLSQAYFSAMSELHRKQIKTLLATYSTIVKKASDDDQELGSSYLLSGTIALDISTQGPTLRQPVLPLRPLARYVAQALC
jgi:hypothetical protein